jgi:hypothetical protein
MSLLSGEQRAIYFGAVRTRHGLTAVWAAALRAWWKECEEESGGSGGAEARRLAALPLGEWRGIRAAAPGHVRNDSAGGGCLTTKVSHSRKHALESDSGRGGKNCCRRREQGNRDELMALKPRFI